MSQSKFIVCPKCKGTGKLLNEAFRGQLDPDIAEDPSFFEEMAAGRYDVQCHHCKGVRVVTEEQDKALQEAEADDEEWRNEIQNEERMLHGIHF